MITHRQVITKYHFLSRGYNDAAHERIAWHYRCNAADHEQGAKPLGDDKQEACSAGGRRPADPDPQVRAILMARALIGMPWYLMRLPDGTDALPGCVSWLDKHGQLILEAFRRMSEEA